MVVEKGYRAGDRSSPATSTACSQAATSGQRRPGAGERPTAKPRREYLRPFIERPVATTLLMAGLASWSRGLPVPARRAAPAGGLPHHPGAAKLPGASPEIMASSVAQPLETQFAQIPGVSQMTSSSVLAAPDHAAIRLDRNIEPPPRTSGGNQRRRRPAAEEPALAPGLPQGEPGRSAMLILAVHSDVLPDRGRQLRGDGDRAAAVAAAGHRPGERRRPAEAGGTRADRPGEARRGGLAARGRRQPHHHRFGGSAPGGDHRPARTTPSTITISCSRPRRGTT